MYDNNCISTYVCTFYKIDTHTVFCMYIHTVGTLGATVERKKIKYFPFFPLSAFWNSKLEELGKSGKDIQILDIQYWISNKYW